MRELATLNVYLLKYKKYLLWGIFFVLVSSVFAIIPAQLVRYAFDLIASSIKAYKASAGQEKDALKSVFTETVWMYVGLILIMALIRGGFMFGMRQMIIVMSRVIEYDMKSDIYQHYQQLPLAFYKKNNTGDLLARISEDVSNVRMYLGPAIMYAINTIGTFILVVAYMLTVNVKLTLFSLLPLPFLSAGIYFVNSLIHERSTQIQQAMSSLTTFVQEAFSGIRVIKAFVREKDRVAVFSEEAENYRLKSMRLVKVNALFVPLIIAMIGVSTLLTVYIGGLEVMEGHITSGNIAEFIIYVNMLIWPVASVGWVTSIIQTAAASQKRINEFLSVKNDLISEKNLTTEIKGGISFRNVSFTYPDTGIEALKNISFDLPAGKTLAVLGTTGAGKSTLANVLCRMYDVSSGEILIDGIPIQEYNLQHLRSQIGYVPQDVFLFSDSIKNNIAFGYQDEILTDEQIRQAAEDADLWQNIQGFEKGLETLLGERGITLSGGQKQRTSIARAIIRNPKILILDDSLSAVDTRTEHKIVENLKRVMKDRTSIIISHRVSTVKLADKIIVLDDANVIQIGTHEELMKLDGVYKELYEKQLQTDEAEI